MKGFWVCLAVASLGLGGCRRLGEETHRPPGQVLRTTINTNPTTLDPARIQDIDTQGIISSVFEGLVSWDERNQIVPQLAEKWEVLGGGRTYLFHLRQGVRFHDGRVMTAEDVRWSLDRCLDPKLGSPTADTYLGDIVGAKERLAGRASTTSGIVAVDPSTVRIQIDHPRPYFLGKLTYSTAFVMPKGVAPEGQEIRSVAQMIGTGPFRAVKFVPEQVLVLEANDAYYGGAPKLRRIEHLVVKDPATRLGKFRAGEVEIAGVEQQNVPGLRRDSALKDALHLYDRPAVAYIAFGRFGYAPFADRRVRRAMAMGIDRRKIVEVLLGGVNPSANGILPPGVLGHRDATAFLPYDPAGAGAELAAAGYPGGRGLPPLEIVYREQTPDSRIIAEAAATQLQANLGIVARPRSMEWRSFLETRNHNKLGAYILAWYADYLDPENFLSNLMTTKSNGNHFGYSNLEVDRLCAQADTSLDQALRTKLYARAEDLILQDAVWLPLYFRREPELVSARVTGLRDNLFGHLPNTTVELK